MIKVLHIILSLGVGGAERVVTDLIKNDQSQTCEHLVCCFDSIGVFGEELKDQGIQVVHIQRRPGKDWRLIFKLASFIRKEKIDVVHTHGETPWFYGALATKLALSSARCITTIHGYGGGDRTSVSDFRLWKFLAMLTDKIVVVADNLRQEMVTVGFSGQKVMTVLNGVSPLQNTIAVQSRLPWGIADRDFVIGIVARLATIKNHQLLFHAFKTFLSTAPNAKLMVIGDGPERIILEQLVVDLNLDNKIIFCGEQQQVQAFYPLFDIFVLPSLSEGISMTLLEAMAAKTVVVASAVGGNCEVIQHEKTGLLFPSGDVTSLSECLKRVYDSAELKQELAEKGFQHLRDSFGLDGMLQNYLKLYRDVCKGSTK